MKKLPFFLGFLLLSVGLVAQQSLLVFLEASEKKPFYVKIGSKTNASSANGQVYVTDLTGNNFDIFVGFPETDQPEHRFPIALKKTDNSFQLKQAGDSWTLIDLETNKVIQPGATTSKTSMPLGGVRKTDAFSVMMAGVVNDTSVLYTSVVSAPPEEIKAPVVTAAVNPVSPELPSTTRIDSTFVKNTDPSSAIQKPASGSRETADSLKKQTEIAANNASFKELSNSEQSTVKTVTDQAKTAVVPMSSVDSSLETAAAREKITRDSVGRVAVAREQTVMDSVARDLSARNAAAKDAAARDAAAKDAAAKDDVAKDDAAKHAAAKDLAAKDSISKDALAKDLSAKEAAEDSLSRSAAIKDSLTKDAIARESALTEAKQKEAAAKESLDKENAAKAALIAENAEKEALAARTEAARKDSIQKAGTAIPASITRVSEQKESKELIIVYSVKEKSGKADTVRISIPIDSPTVIAPRRDSIFPRWQSNPRPLTDPVVSKKESAANPGQGGSNQVSSTPVPGNQGTNGVNGKSAPPVTKGPVMINSDCVNFATEYDLDKLRVKMIAEVSADDRVAAAKKVFRTKCFSTRQIRALTELFLNDEGKYKFLDTAYPFVSDSQEFRNLVGVLKEDYYVKRFNAMIRL